MTTMAEAFKKLQSDENLGEMVQQSIKRVEDDKQRKAARKLWFKQSRGAIKRYEEKILATYQNGLGNLLACSLLGWKPGKPIEVHGKSARVRWFLKNTSKTYAVVEYAEARQVRGLPEKCHSKLFLVPLSWLSECTCNGYVHGKTCIKEKAARSQ